MNTKLLFLLMSFCAVGFSAQAKGGKFTVSGRLGGAAPGDRVVLVRFAAHNYSPLPCDIADTVLVSADGSFAFSGRMDAECPAKLLYLTSAEKKPPFPPDIYFALVPGKTVINASATDFRKSAVVRNKLYDKKALAFLAAEEALDAQLDTISAQGRRAAQAKDTATVSALRLQREKVKEAQKELYNSFFKKDTPFAAFAYLSTARIYRDDASGNREVYDNFAPKAKNSGFADIVRHKCEHADSVQVGKPCPELFLVSRAGEKVRLTDYAGKYLLISHWGAACGGSHYADPFITKIYEKYHPYGLEILGTTDPSRVYINFKDPSKAPADMKEYIMNTFKHPYPDIDLSQGDNYLFERRFDVGGTPYLVFVSPEGEILAVSLGTEALEVVNKTMETIVAATKE